MKKIENSAFDQERALYNLTDAEVVRCRFEGEADGESALKESKRFVATDCSFALRYPMWHCDDFSVKNCVLTETCRAPLWYDKNGALANCKILGVKTLRECTDMTVTDCDVDSIEFGWKCHDVKIERSTLNSQYFLLMSSDIEMTDCRFSGKYSFQYVTNATITDCVLDTKDAFWHSRNVVVKNCVVKGEYLGWYSDGLTFIDCQISGTQPLCYCKNLKLINCTMTDCDLSFEYSDVQADIVGTVTSVKNPHSGTIVADGYGEIITEGGVMEDTCQVVVREQSKQK